MNTVITRLLAFRRRLNGLLPERSNIMKKRIIAGMMIGMLVSVFMGGSIVSAEDPGVVILEMPGDETVS